MRMDAGAPPIRKRQSPAYYTAASSVSGLGYEYDYAWNGAFWDDFGYGGAYQAGYFG